MLKIYNREIPVQFFNATVIHANKYTEASGGWFHFPVTSTLYTDLVFRLKDSGKDCTVYISNLDLPVYNSQEVSIISTDSAIIGFIDNTTKRYYYTTRDFSGRLKIGFSIYWFILAGLLVSAAVYFIQNQQFTVYTLLPLIAGIFIFYIQKWILNYLIQRLLDKYLQ